MFQKELTIIARMHKGNKIYSEDTLWYQFMTLKDGKLKNCIINKKGKNTIDIFEEVLANFFIQKKLISISYKATKITPCGEEYLGIRLENNKEEKLNIYYSSKALDALNELERLIRIIKMQDFYYYAKRPIEKGIVDRFTIRATAEERSSVLFVLEEKNIYDLSKSRQLGYYYHKYKSLDGKIAIEESDLQIIFNLIRLFINTHLEHLPRYIYSNNDLYITSTTGAYIEVKDEDLITEIEHAYILDDLWLVMNGVIDQMPLQEEAMEERQTLRLKKKEFLEKRKRMSNKSD